MQKMSILYSWRVSGTIMPVKMCKSCVTDTREQWERIISAWNEPDMCMTDIRVSLQ